MLSPDELSTLSAASKRPYTAPALVVHGDVQTLTQDQSGYSIDPLVASTIVYVGQ